ncbi:MAG: M20/M25/M40 family metallo-hydrolase [Armatimonadetes bacterium]|nr:M20/M25/M40 family metallo-hydrolase [Armatimonadota bacterium]
MINKERLLDTFLTLCRTNTPARAEGPVADYLQARLERLGLECRRDGAGAVTASETGNLIAVLPGNVDGAETIFFAAHMDTVEPNPDVQIVIEGDTIRTDGTTILGADDRAGIAPLVEAIETIVENGLPHGPVEAVFTVCEEVGLLGAKALDRGMLRARYGFVLDSSPPVGAVVSAAPSQDSFHVVITGKPAHAGAEPEKGISAIQVAARAIERMRLGRIDPETTANIGVISGGDATNIVCPSVLMRAEARSRNPEKLAEQVRHMVETWQEAADYYGATVDVQVDHQYDAYRFAESDPVVAMALAAARKAGLPATMKEAGGGSDANVFNALGLPTCVLGAAMTGVHTHEERASIADLCATAELVVAIISEAAAAHAGSAGVSPEAAHARSAGVSPA